MMIYKYREFDDCGYSISGLQNSTLWFATPDTWDDKDDCAIPVHIFGNRDDFRKYLFESYVNHLTPERLGALIRIQTELFDKDPKLITDKLNNNIKVEMLKYGICCFSWQWSNSHLWQNFAGSSTGFCIAFNGAALLAYYDSIYNHPSQTFFNSFMVEYEKDLPQINWLSNEPNEILKIFRIKKKSYSSEEEFRITLKGEPNKEVKYLLKTVLGVIAGDKISTSNLTILEEVAHGLKLPLFQIERDLDSKITGYKLIQDI